MSDALFLEEIKTPVGGMTMISSRDGVLHMLEFQYREARWRPIAARRFKGATFVQKPSGHRQTLDRYFDGDIAALDDIETDGDGTEFQRAIWTRLREIPPGATTSYGAIAREIGKPAAMRAVGHANGANPIAIVVPCHRVIGRDGSLTGYGGGLPQKHWLLEHEARHAVQTRRRA
ncbi:MAG TPA: methylated-DNA--[protein]-cysteine S-methyltransferase [Rhizomicrobium sp.]|nr:methylated-DNA--[protein]-cysteine S-methyltransferase [Rhizomicrobium sp.]